jgi:hypothetical protein
MSYMKYEGEVVMQAKGVKGLWFVREAERDHSFLTKEKKTAVVASAFWACGI